MTSEAEQVITEFFVEREGEGAMASIRDMDLVDGGVLDSLDFVTLAVFVEGRFGRKLDLSDPATFAAMRRFDTLVALVDASGDAPGTDARPTT